MEIALERYRSGRNGTDSKSIHSRSTPFSEVLAPQGFPDAPGRKWGKVLSKSSLHFPGEEFWGKSTWSGIEAVITALTRNQVYGNVPWVRIPPAPPMPDPHEPSVHAGFHVFGSICVFELTPGSRFLFRQFGRFRRELARDLWRELTIVGKRCPTWFSDPVRICSLNRIAGETAVFLHFELFMLTAASSARSGSPPLT